MDVTDVWGNAQARLRHSAHNQCEHMDYNLTDATSKRARQYQVRNNAKPDTTVMEQRIQVLYAK